MIDAVWKMWAFLGPLAIRVFLYQYQIVVLNLKIPVKVVVFLSNAANRDKVYKELSY